MVRYALVPLFLVASTALLADDVQAGKGYLGVFLGVPSPGDRVSGVVIGRVAPGSSAAKAGIQAHDVIDQIDGKKVVRPRDVVEIIGAKKSGETVILKIARDGKTSDFLVTLGDRIASEVGGGGADSLHLLDPAARRGFLGVGFAEVPQLLAWHLRLENGVGLLVGNVLKDSAAAKAGIGTNDVIVKIGDNDVMGGNGLVALLKCRLAGEKITANIIQRGEWKKVEITLGERPVNLSGRDYREMPLRRFPKWFPGDAWRGRLKIDDEVFEIPWGQWDVDELERKFHEHFKDKLREERLRAEIDKAMKNLKSRFRTNRSETRIVDGDYDIRIVTIDGETRFSVTKGEEVIANDLPYDDADTLPEGVRQRVESLLQESIETDDARTDGDDEPKSIRA